MRLFSLRKPKCKYVFWILGALLISLSLGCLIPTKWINSEKVGSDKVWVEDVGVHTNIVIPVKNDAFDWHQHLSLKELDARSGKDYRYLSFGWGDRLFYTQTPTPADFKLSNALDALLIPGESVMYVEGRYELSANVPIKCIKVSRQEYLNLVNYLQNSFQLDSQKKAIFAAKSYNPNGTFYAAKGSYSILRNCNVWTGEALRSANINTPLWSALSSVVMWHLPDDC